MGCFDRDRVRHPPLSSSVQTMGTVAFRKLTMRLGHNDRDMLPDLAHSIEHDHDEPFPPSTIDDARPVHCIRVSISLVSITLPFTHSTFAKQVVKNHEAHVFYPHSTHSQLLAARLGCIF